MPPEAVGAVQPDPALIQRILDEEAIRVDRSAGLGDYVSALTRWAWDRFTDLVGDSPGIQWLSDVLLWLALIAIPVVLVALAWPLLREGWRGRRHRRRGAPSARVEQVALPPEPDPEADLAAALADGDARGVVRAMWAALARRLTRAGKGRWGPELTHHEFVESAARLAPRWEGLEALGDVARQSDRLLYGPHAPAMTKVLPLVDRAREIVP